MSHSSGTAKVTIEVDLGPDADAACVEFVGEFFDAHEDIVTKSIDLSTGVVLGEIDFTVEVDCGQKTFDATKV